MHIEEVKLTKENLIKIKEIDNTFYTKESINLDWYLERYNKNHSAILLLDGDKVVGYIISVPIKKELYDTIINGVIINDLQINPQMFINKSEYLVERYMNFKANVYKDINVFTRDNIKKKENV